MKDTKDMTATVVDLSDFVLFKAAGLNPAQALELVEQRRKHEQELHGNQPPPKAN